MMENKEVDVKLDDLYYAVRDNLPGKVKLLMGQDWDIYRAYGVEGNILSVAILNAGVEVLAELLGVKYPLRKERVVLPYEKHKLLNSPCDEDGLTPLMKLASRGRCDAISFAIACGAEVNVETSRQETAIDHSLRQSDSNVVLLLLKADAVFSKHTLKEGRNKLNQFINENEELQGFFERREKLHDALISKRFDAEIEASFEEEVSSYYINRNGESALWQAALNLNYDAWAYLNNKGAKLTSKAEADDVEIAKQSHEDNFNKALVKYYFQIKGTHVMKMVTKSIVFRKKRRLEDLGVKVDGFFKSLDQDELTGILLEVLQDEHDLDIVFDFDSSNLEYVHPNSYGKVWGMMDARRRRVYISARESENYSRVDVIRTLAHELAHKAITLVFENHGKPYKEEDKERETEYKGILRDVLSSKKLGSCDEIIKRVLAYDEDLREQELIVRVPEMIAKYQEQDSMDSDGEDDDRESVADERDGMERLESQVPKLLKYYEEYVMPSFQSYVEKNLTSNRMTIKSMSEYQKLLNAAHFDQIEVSADIGDFHEYIHCHNGLKILRISNVRLSRSHVITVLRRKGERILCINWSQLIQSESEFLDGLADGAIGVMVVVWDQDDKPPLCKRKRCRSTNCIANKFRGMFDNVIVLLPMTCSSLKEVKPLEYKWEDLSEKTKKVILDRKLDFGGEESTVEKLIGSVMNDEEFQCFLAANLGPCEISYLLEEKGICVGKPTGWQAEGAASRNTFYHKDCYIKRSLNHGCFNIGSFKFDNTFSDIFVISNCTVEEVSKCGVPDKYISLWNGSCVEGDVRCYVLDPSTDINSEMNIFNEICSQYHGNSGIHRLQFQDRHLVYLNSFGSVENIIGHMDYEINAKPITENEIMDQVFCLETYEADDKFVPMVIADDPGCGKSFIINNFASEIKKHLSDVWICVIDLNFYAQTKSSAHLRELDSINYLNPDEVIGFLYRMVSKGNSSFERNLFGYFCRKKHKVIAMFDGFDEVCPTYGQSVSKFLKALMENTAVKVVVTTRLHEKYNLEKSLNNVAYKLVPFTFEEQNFYLDRYWNLRLNGLSRENRLSKMRDLHSGMEKWLGEDDDSNVILALNEMANAISEAENEIISNGDELKTYSVRNINFEIYGKQLLIRINILSQDDDQFMQTPLHIQMTAFIAYEDDFNVTVSLNLGHLYQRFFEIKMKIFDVEKVISSGNVSAEKASTMVKDRAYEILDKLSANLFFDPNYYKCKKTDMVNALSIGLVAEKEETYQFVHRTFGEFFFAKWLLRKSCKEVVTRFWLESLFADKVLFRVRCFLEDIVYLQLHVFAKCDDDVSLEYEKVLLNPSALSGLELSRSINACIFSIIVNHQLSLLQYFVDGFGVEVVKLLLVNQNFPSGETETVEDCVRKIMRNLPEKPIDIVPTYLDDCSLSGHRIYRHPKLRMSEPSPRYNAFTLVCRKLSLSKESKKYIEMVKKMFYLITEHHLVNLMSEVISEHGLNCLLPSVMDGSCFENYMKDLVSFLTGEHKHVFRDSLKKSFLEKGDSWKKDDVKSIGFFNLMKCLTDSVLEESEFSLMFLKNDDFFKYWKFTLRRKNVSDIKNVWEYVSSKLICNDEQLQFIMRSEIDRSDIFRPKFVNALTITTLNPDPLAIHFVWEIASSLMTKDEYMHWLHQSFIVGKPSDPINRVVPKNAFKFLESLLSFGYLSEDEMVDLILSKDEEGNSYFLCINDCYLYECDLIVYFYNFLFCCLRYRAGEILIEMKSSLWTVIKALTNGSECCWGENEDFFSQIDAEFKSIVECDTFGLMDNLHVENELIVGTPKKFKVQDFKTLVVTFYKILKLESECLGKYSVLEHEEGKYMTYSRSYTNVLSVLVNHKNSLVIGYVCSILMQLIPHDYLLRLLFMVNSDGDSVFHEAAKKKDFYSWGKLYDVARILLKEEALSEVHAAANKVGECVHDIFLKS